MALVENGFRVLAVDKNAACISKAKDLLDGKGINENQVVFIEGDITDESFRKKLIESYPFDVVACWNVGSYWSKKMVQYYLPHMLEYGLNIQQIHENPESSYAELIIWQICRLAKSKNVPVHIVDRTNEFINSQNDPYYSVLKGEVGYSEITYDNLCADSISNGGRVLTTNGTVNMDKLVNIVFVSLLMR